MKLCLVGPWDKQLDMLHSTIGVTLAYWCRFNALDQNEDPMTIPMSSLDGAVMLDLLDDVRSLMYTCPELEFLKGMSIDQFNHWVFKCFLTYFQLQDKGELPRQAESIGDVITIVRAYRKARNKAKKAKKEGD